MTFDSLGLSADLVRIVAEEGYETPTPVQAAAIPLVLAGPRRPRGGPDRAPARPRPSCCRSSTGCGRTRTPASRRPATRSASLILVPTRELAMQVDESVRTYGRTVPLRSTVVYGGIPMDPQIKALRGGIEILVATPGPPARPRRPAGRQPRPGRDPRPRRGRPDARHGLPAGHPADHRAAPGQAPEPDVLGDVLRRHPAPVGDDPARPGDGRGRAAQHDRRGDPPARLPGRSRPQGGAAGPPHPQGRPAPGARLHPDEARPPRGWRPGSTARASTPSRSTPTARSRSGRARSRASRRGEIRVLVATDVAARGLDIEDLPRRRQLRAAVEPAGLHPPDRPDRPGRRDGRGDLPRLHRRDRPAARRPADAQAGDPVDGRGGVHPRPRTRSRGRSGRGPVTPGSARSTTPIASPSGGGRAPGAPAADRRPVPTGRSPGTTRGTGADVPGRCQETVRRLRRRCRSGRPRRPGRRSPA